MGRRAADWRNECLERRQQLAVDVDAVGRVEHEQIVSARQYVDVAAAANSRRRRLSDGGHWQRRRRLHTADDGGSVGHGRHAARRVPADTRSPVSVTPQVLARLEALAARALERPSSRVDALMQAHCRRVLERLTTDAALARVVAVVPVEVMLLQVDFELEADVADVAAVRSRDAVHGQVSVERQRRRELFAAARAN